MKKLKVYILAMCVIWTTSCDDFIDLRPTDLISDENALETVTDFQQALVGCYNTLVSPSYYGGSFITTADWMSDDFRRSPENLGQGVQMHSYIFNAATGEPSGLWFLMYSTINRANLLLSKIDGLDADESVKNSIKGQALFIRGMAHFDLLRYFADPFDATPDASHLGVPLMTQSIISEPTRNTVAEVYAQVLTDLQSAKLLMTNAEGPIKATPAAASALLARVSLYMENWNDAITHATDAINASGALATGDNYRNIWTSAESNSEVIFKLDMVAGNATMGSNYWGEINDIAFFNPVQDLIDAYGANDVRLGSFIGLRQPADPDNLFIKYRGAALGAPLTTPPSIPGLADIKLIRVSEMYLIRAEANYELGNEALALSDLNALRAARITGFVPGAETGSALENAIHLERRKELVGEGHRWFDLKRRGLPIERGPDCSATQCTLEAGNFRFNLPIPQDEMFANPNMVQNEGYDD